VKYFKFSEFDSPDEIGSGNQMNKDFLKLLDIARESAMIPFKINSGFRTVAHNVKCGGVSNSSHLKGYAADISCTSSAQRIKILTSLFEVGFTRIGISKSFIHVDNDFKKTDSVWLY